MIDIRKVKQDETIPSLTVSLLYFNQLNEKVPKQKPNIITVDTTKKVLKHSKDNISHLVMFGEFQGMGCLQTPINKPSTINKDVEITTRQ